MTTALGLGAYLTSQAAASGSSSFNIGPSPVTVGTKVDFNFSIKNAADAPQDTETVELTLITGYPSCNVIDAGAPGFAPCDQAADQNAGTFTPEASATGALGTACAGTNFTVTKAASGLWTFTPAGGNVVLQPANLGAGNPLTTCVINGKVTLNSLPADGNAGSPGIQTRQLSYAQGFTTTSLDEFVGTGSTSITVQAPDIKVEKTAANPAVNAGDVAQFNIVVTNLGPGTATAVTLTDNLPAVANGWTLGGPDAGACGIAANVLSCNFGDLAQAATKTISLSTTTTTADCKALPNTATVAATNEDQSKLANNTSSTTINVTCPNVKIEKSGNGPLAAGGTATFTIKVTNLGPGTASNVQVADTLAGTGWTDDRAECTVTPGANDALSCTFPSIAALGSETIIVSRTTTAQDCPKIDNTATVTANGDTNANDNSASASIVVNCGDVKIEKSGNGPLSAGQTAKWTIVVTNNGPTTATNVKVADTLPGTGWTDDSNDCTVTAGVNDVLNCTIPSLVFPGSATVHVSRATKAADCPKIDNTATVTADIDTDPTNNSSKASIDVTCPPDVTILKTGNGPLTAGQTATWTIVVTNNGPGTATNVKVADTLPGTGWTDDSADCTVTAGVNDVLGCTYASIAAGATKTVHVSRATANADCPKIDNTATVTADLDANSGNNSSSASITVNCPITTRTIGYWSTHRAVAVGVWNGTAWRPGGPVLGPVPAAYKNWPCGTVDIGVEGVIGDNEVMGGFWANIAKTSGGGARTALDQARMRLAQQLLGAILNTAAFGSVPADSVEPGGAPAIDGAIAALCGTNVTLINAYQGLLGTFNQSGDAGIFEAGVPADTAAAKADANIAAWDDGKP